MIRFASNRSYVIGAQFPDARSPRQILYGGVLRFVDPHYASCHT